MNEADFDKLYAATARPLLAYLLRRVPAEDAADLLSEAMTIAWTRRADLPSETERTPWLFGVARNLMSAHHRRGLQQRELINRLAETLAPAVPQPDPNRLDLSRALCRLRPLDAEILTLAAWEGFTSVEIGIMLELPAGTVRTRLRRARARLRTTLGLTPAEESRPTHPATPSQRQPLTDHEQPGPPSDRYAVETRVLSDSPFEVLRHLRPTGD